MNDSRLTNVLLVAVALLLTGSIAARGKEDKQPVGKGTFSELELVDKRGKPRIRLCFVGQGQPQIEILGPTGKTRVAIGVAEKEAYVGVYEPGGAHPRVKMALLSLHGADKPGEATLSVMNSKNQRCVVIGVGGGQDPRVSVEVAGSGKGKRPVASLEADSKDSLLRIFDSQGNDRVCLNATTKAGGRLQFLDSSGAVTTTVPKGR